MTLVTPFEFRLPDCHHILCHQVSRFSTIYKRTQDYSENFGIGPVEMKQLLKDIPFAFCENVCRTLSFKDASLTQKLSDIRSDLDSPAILIPLLAAAP